MTGCTFCVRLEQLLDQRAERGDAWYAMKVCDLFDLADRTHRLHIAYGRRRRKWR